MAEFVLKDFFFLAPQAGRAGGETARSDIKGQLSKGKGLRVNIIASHAGKVNSNHVMYTASGMEGSLDTWVSPFNKPIEIHHDDMADPIGRVTGARFVPFDRTSQDNKDLADEIGIFLDARKADEVFEAVELLEDAGVLDREDWKGVGQLVLEGEITDLSAAEKVLDGRYKTVSTGQKPKEAYCSICKTNWIGEGRCNHRRGETYNIGDEENPVMRKMYLVVGKSKYAEISYVNHPADEDAMNSSAEVISLKDCVQDSKAIDLDTLDKAFVEYSLIEADNSMTLQDKENTPADLEDILDQENQEESQEEEANDDPMTIEEALKVIFEDEEVTDEVSDLINEEIESLITEEEKDAKLSPEKRKALPASTFCGPNKSFPVNDCAHYTAAKRLIGRYKGPGDKSKILSCIESKGKKLGCPGTKKKDSDEQESVCDMFAFEKLEDKELLEQIQKGEKEAVTRGLKLTYECKDCEEKEASLVELKESAQESEDILKSLRVDYSNVVQEHISSETSHSETLEEYRKSLMDFVKLQMLLIEKDMEEDEIDSKIKEMSLKELKESSNSFDLKETIDVVRTGVTPAAVDINLNEEDANADVQDREDTNNKALLDASRSIMNMRRRAGLKAAISHINRLVKAGLVDSSFTVDKAEEILAQYDK